MSISSSTTTAAQRELVVATQGPGLYDITESLRAVVRGAGVLTGLCNVFVLHTSASLLVQENASRAVQTDLLRWFARLAPEGPGLYEHDDEGPDDMPAHLRAAVTRTSETIPVAKRELALGTWQAVYLFEHRRAAHQRRVLVTVLGV